MRKKLLFIISIFCLLFVFLTSCGFGVGEIKEIDDIKATVLDDGSTQITITYVDNLFDPLVFVIPKGETGETGETGEKGNGIKEVTIVGEGLEKEVQITFTDPAMKPFTYPVKDGVGVKKIETKYDEETGNTNLVIIFTDNSKSDPIPIPRGEKGVGIIGIDKEVKEDKSVTLTIHMSDGSSSTVDIPAPEKGDTGKGIAAMVGTTDKNIYKITIIYTDDTMEILKFDKPADPNKWYTGDNKPTDTFGNDGDFYFDIVHNTIYSKQEGSWGYVVDFDGKDETFSVTFDLSDYPDALLNSSKKSYDLKSGSNFASSKFQIPLPTRDGYTFTGWYTEKEINANSGKFTDLTSVCGNLVLYPQWVENN